MAPQALPALPIFTSPLDPFAMHKLLFFFVFFFYWNGLAGQTYQELVQVRDSLLRKQNYKISLPYCEKAATLALTNFGDTSYQYIDAIIKHRKTQAYLSQYTEAASGYNEIEASLARTQRDSGELGIAYYNMRYLAAFAQNQLAEAEKWVRKAIQNSEKIHGKSNRLTIGYLNNLSNILTRQGKYKESEQILLGCKSAFEEQGLQKHQFYSNFLGNLGNICYYTENYIEAEKYHQLDLKLNQELGNNFSVLKAKHNLYSIYANYPHKWIERRMLLDEILSGYKNSIGVNTKEYAGTLLSRAKLFYNSYNHKDALKDLYEAKKIIEDIGTTKTEEYFTILTYIGNVYLDTNDTLQAHQFLSKSLQLRTEIFGRESESYYQGLVHMSYYYIVVNDPSRVEPLLIEARKFFEQKKLTKKSIYKRVLSYQQGEYQRAGRYTDAEALLDTLYRQVINDPRLQHSLVLDLFEARINLYQNTGNHAKLLANLEELGTRLYDLAKKEMFALPEKDRFLFNTKLKKFNDQQLSIALQNIGKPNLPLIYDQIFLRKNLILNTALQVKKQINTNSDSISIRLYHNWVSLKERLVYLYTLPADRVEISGYNVTQLAERADSIEQQLSLRSAPFKNLQQLSNKTWLDIRATLHPDEASVDIVRFDKNNSDNNKAYQAGYAVFIIKHNYTEPQLLFIDNGNNLNSFIYEQYASEIKSGKAPSSEVYQAFWGKIDPYLKGIKTVFIAPDGIYHKINLNSLRRADGKFLSEVYDIRILQSMGELLELAPEAPVAPCSALLVGNPRFDVAVANGVRTTEGMNWRNILLDSSFVLASLPASAREVDEISALLMAQGCVVESLLDTAATEVKVKAVYSPRVLHLATHGHFLKSPKRERLLFDENETNDNPMLRSMLFFTGATNTLQEQPLPEHIGDGVFTAYEAINLNLDGTELVILSACNTGLGKIENGEGVFGMQRAFRYAGAHYVVMSLWEVEDKATLVFMTTFYRYWLTKKKSIPEAFRQTQLDLQKMMPPFQWGAFVLIGK